MKILFTHLKPDIWQYKVASTLKRKGIKTISISLLSFDKKLFNKAFDEIISPELKNLKPKTLLNSSLKHPFKIIKFFYKLLTIKADAAICQGAPHYLTAFFIWLCHLGVAIFFYFSQYIGKSKFALKQKDINFSRSRRIEVFLFAPRQKAMGVSPWYGGLLHRQFHIKSTALADSQTLYPYLTI